MQTESLSPRQLTAFCLAALSAPAVTVCAGLPWQWVLALSILFCTIVLGLAALWRAAGGKALPQQYLLAWGRPWGTVLLSLTAVFTLTVLWRLLRLTDSAFPDDRVLPFVPLVLLAVCAWACFHGRAAVVRAVGVMFVFGAALYAVVFVFALPDVRWQMLTRPPQTVSLLSAAVLGLPLYGVFLTGGSAQPGRPRVWWLGGFLLLPAAAAAFCAGVPGSEGSFYEMAKSVEVFSVAQRIEPVVSALLTAGWFAAICLLGLSAGEMAKVRWGDVRIPAVAFCALGIPGCLWDLHFPGWYYAGFGTVFCVIFPILTLGIVLRKNFEKK